MRLNGHSHNLRQSKNLAFGWGSTASELPSQKITVLPFRTWIANMSSLTSKLSSMVTPPVFQRHSSTLKQKSDRIRLRWIIKIDPMDLCRALIIKRCGPMLPCIVAVNEPFVSVILPVKAMLFKASVTVTKSERQQKQSDGSFWMGSECLLTANNGGLE